jgi:hypothetical protein
MATFTGNPATPDVYADGIFTVGACEVENSTFMGMQNGITAAAGISSATNSTFNNMANSGMQGLTGTTIIAQGSDFDACRTGMVASGNNSNIIARTNPTLATDFTTFDSSGNGIAIASGETHTLTAEAVTFSEVDRGIVINGTNTDLRNLHCNTFAPTNPMGKRGIVIGANGGLVNGLIGRPYAVNSQPPYNVISTPAGNQFIAAESSNPACPYPATMWSPTCEVTDWLSPQGWMSIENLSPNSITYHRYFNEFVGATSGSPGVVVETGEYTVSGNTQETYLLVPGATLSDPAPFRVNGCPNFESDFFPTEGRIRANTRKLEISSSPNPANGAFSVLLSLPLPENDIVELYSPLAAEPIETVSIKKGETAKTLGSVALMPGCYQVRLRHSGLATRVIIK